MTRYAIRTVLTFVFTIPVCASGQTQNAQPSPGPIDFDVVSIKKNTSGNVGGGMRSLPDGTMVMTNQPIRSLISGATTEITREVVGVPDWAMSERYDITAKPPAGATRQQQRVMMQRMFADRFKAVVHVEQRERDGFALVLARADGKLGPNLKPSTLDCGPRPPGTPPPPPPTGPPTAAEAAKRCGGLFGPGLIVSGGTPIGAVAPSLQGLVGGPIDDRTGLTGAYAFELHYSVPRRADPNTDAAPDPSDAPDIFTALQEQLGLKLQREKITIPVLVIDHLERPTEN